MAIPVNALPASTQRESVLSAPQTQKITAPVREAGALDGLEKTARPTSSQRKEALDEINRSLKMASIGVRFEFDKAANTLVTQVVDVESGELIRQMPSDEMVRIARIMNNLTGLLFSKTA
jgi:flagellar protein FlaG